MPKPESDTTSDEAWKVVVNFLLNIIVILVIFLLPGCAYEPEWDTTGHPMMTNDQIIAATRKCRDAGLDAWPVPHYDAPITDIICQPRNHAR